MSNETEDYKSLYQEHHQAVFASPSLIADSHISSNYFFPGAAPQAYLPPTSTAYDAGNPIIYSDSTFTSQFGEHMSPNMLLDDFDYCTSSLSADSGPSTTSSTVGSPLSYHDMPTSVPDLSIPNCLSVSPNIASHNDFYGLGEYSYSNSLNEYEYVHFDISQSDKPFIGKFYFFFLCTVRGSDREVLKTAKVAESPSACYRPLLLR